MKISLKNLSTLAALFLTATSFACDIEGKTGFAPQNNLRISQWDKETNGMTQEKFLEIIKSVSDIYAPIVKSKGGILNISARWDDDTVNANALRYDTVWVVNMYGGLARHPLVTDDGFTLVICHELGHQLGGAPRWGALWAASEGQADYFGTMKCLRRVFEKQDNMAVISKMTVDAEATNKCELVYKNAAEIALCQRIAMAGKSMANFLGAAFWTPARTVNFSTPDLSVVTQMDINHPAPQCRLDTFFNGILCDKSYDQENDNTDPKIGTCIARDGYKVGPRPLCWYKPSDSEI